MDHLHMTHEEALKAAPAEEPGRQQFFMERCRQLIDEKKRRGERTAEPFTSRRSGAR